MCPSWSCVCTHSPQLPTALSPLCRALLLALRRSPGRFPRPAALPAPAGCCSALGRGGGSAAIGLEGEAESREQPGNGLHAMFPTAVTLGLGSAAGREPLCLPRRVGGSLGEQLLGNSVPRDFCSLSTRLYPKQSHCMSL